MLIEILDCKHINGKPHYFTSPNSRDDFITTIKDSILKISDKELKEIQTYWKKQLNF